MKKGLRIGVMILLVAVFAGSVFMLFSRNADYEEAEAEYAEAEQLAELPDLSDLPAPVPEPVEPEPESVPEPEEKKVVYVDPYADALRNMDFVALRKVNKDVLGWILIPGTKVSYPVVQGEDNQYYLNRTWKQWRSAVGAIFMESRSSRDLSDFNTVIYGHRMNNGSMFASLKYYKDQSYWEEHPCVYITDDSGSHKYDIFAAYEVTTDGPAYQIGFSGDASKQAFLEECMALSAIETGITPTVYDRVLTLSTCTGRGHETRWVVQAVLKGEVPAEIEELPAEEKAAEELLEEELPMEKLPVEELPAEEPSAEEVPVQETEDTQPPQ